VETSASQGRLDNASITMDFDSKELSCGRSTSDDCGCADAICKQWGQWTAPRATPEEDLPLCLSTWSRQTANPMWFTDRVLISSTWAKETPNRPHVLCVRSRTQFFEVAPFIARTKWWLSTIAGSMCSTENARASSGIIISPRRQHWQSYSLAMESWLGQAILRRSAHGYPVCWADGIADHIQLDALPDGRVVPDYDARREWAAVEKKLAEEVSAGELAWAHRQFPVGTYVQGVVVNGSSFGGLTGTVVGHLGQQVLVGFVGRQGKKSRPSDADPHHESA